MPIPASTSRPRRSQMINGMLSHIKKPDIDNLNKFLCDCLKGIVFVDDAQVVELNCRKIYSQTPRTVVKITSLI